VEIIHSPVLDDGASNAKMHSEHDAITLQFTTDNTRFTPEQNPTHYELIALPQQDCRPAVISEGTATQITAQEKSGRST